MSTGIDVNTTEYIFPIFASNVTTKKDRFIGTGFFIDNEGTFATCEHVLSNCQDEEELCIKYLLDMRKYQIEKIKNHNSIDLAIGKIADISGNKYLNPYINKILPGFPINAWAFYSEGEGILYPRFQCGHIIGMRPNITDLYRCNTIIETSFHSMPGFSGTPIWDIKTLNYYGMLHGNIESTINVYKFEEVEENGEKLKESICRVVEYGMAHPVKDILTFYQEYYQ